MIHAAIEFADKVAREVMTPRTDIRWISASASLVEVARISEETGYSRLPVCVEDLDHVVGILYMKDIVSVLGTERPDLTAGHLARKPPPMVPESKKIHEVLSLMQRRRLHMAIVIDEYGGTAGVVTLEDLRMVSLAFDAWRSLAEGRFGVGIVGQHRTMDKADGQLPQPFICQLTGLCHRSHSRRPG